MNQTNDCLKTVGSAGHPVFCDANMTKALSTNLCIIVLLPAFWGEQVQATGNSINSAAAEAIM